MLNVLTVEGRVSPAMTRLFSQFRYSIFAEEFGWTLETEPTTGLPRDDGFDLISRFTVAYQLESRRIVGGVRTTNCASGIPRLEYLKEVASHPIVARNYSQLCTLNSLAITPEWRGRNLAGRRESRHSVAKTLVGLALSAEHVAGASIALLSAVPGASRRLFSQLGFFTISEETSYIAAKYPLVNMGLCLNDRDHLHAVRSPLLQYINPKPMTDDERALSREFGHWHRTLDSVEK